MATTQQLAVGANISAYNLYGYTDADTFNTNNPGVGGVLDEIADWTIPAGDAIRRVRAKVRFSVGASGISDTYVQLKNPASQALPADYYGGLSNTGYQTYVGPWKDTAPDGGAWTQAKLNALRIMVEDRDAYGKHGSPSFPGPFFDGIWVDVETNTRPTATGVALGTLDLNSFPTWDWTYTDPEGDSQKRFRVKVYDAAQYGAGGFDPNTTTPLYDSGDIYSSDTQWAQPSALANKSYRAYIFVHDGYQWNAVTSAGPYSSATITIDVPATPQVDLAPDQNNARMAVVWGGRDNRLATQDATFEGGIGGWVSSFAGVLSHSTTQFFQGTGSMRVARSSAGNGFTAVSAAPTLAPGALPGYWYTSSFRMKAETTSEQVLACVRFFDTAGTIVGTFYGAPQMSSTTEWKRCWASGYAPANATRVVCMVYALGATPIFVDTASVVPRGYMNILDYNQSVFGDGATTGWTPAGGNTIAVTQAYRNTLNPDNYALELSNATGGANTPYASTFHGVGDRQSIIVGNLIHAAVRVRRPPGQADTNARMVLTYYNAAGTVMGQTTGSFTLVTDAAASTDSWTMLSRTEFVPSGADRVGVAVQGQTGTAGAKFIVGGAMILTGANALQDNQSGAEVDYATIPSDLGAATNCTLTRSTTSPLFGSGGHLLTSIAAGDMTIRTTPVTNQPVTPGQSVKVGAWSIASGTARSVRVSILWYDSALALLSSTDGTSGSNASWTERTLTATAPANAAYYALRLTVLAAGGAGEAHYFDGLYATVLSDLPADIVPGPYWTRGGLLTAQRGQLQRSLDGVTWEDVERVFSQTSGVVIDLETYNVNDAMPRASLWDYEAPRGVPVYYRARSFADMGGTVISSPWSPVYLHTLPSDNAVWLKDTEVPTQNRKVTLIAEGDSMEVNRPEDHAIVSPLTEDYKLKISGEVRGREYQLQFLERSEADMDALRTLYTGQNTLLLQWEDGDQEYVEIDSWREQEPTINTSTWLTRAALVETGAP